MQLHHPGNDQRINISATSSEIIDRIMDEANIYERNHAYHVIRGVLVALRKRFTIREMSLFTSGLPTFLRASFYEGWNPKEENLPWPSRDEDFFEAVQCEISKPECYAPDLEDAVEGTCKVLVSVMDHQILEALSNRLPEDFRRFMGDQDAELHWQFRKQCRGDGNTHLLS